MRNLIVMMVSCLLGGFLAGAQPRLVVQGIGELVGDEYAPRYVVLTQDFVNSPEWQDLDERIDAFLSANMAYDDEPDEDDAAFDWDGYIANLEEAIENFVREGDEAMAENYRQNLEEVKKYRAEMEDPEAHAEAVEQAEAAEQERQALLDEVLQHAVGGRFFYYAEAQQDGRAVLVYEAFWDGSDDVTPRLLDATGKMVAGSKTVK